MKRNNCLNVYRIVLTVSLTILLIAVVFSLVMMLVAVATKAHFYAELCLIGLTVMSLTFIIFAVALVLGRKQRKRRKSR